MKLDQAVETLKKLGNEKQKKTTMRYFKTGEGSYGEGDKFIGVSIPDNRQLAINTEDFSYELIDQIIQNEYHEIRLYAGMVMVKHFESLSKDIQKQKELADFYVSHIKYLNNWDLIDLTCYKVLGPYLLNFEENSEERKILFKLADSTNLWEQRTSIVTTMSFVRANQLDELYQISLKLLPHKHDLINKAVGWLLREAGKRNVNKLIDFIKQNYSLFGRTTLRYCIERLEPKQKQYLMTLGKK